MCRPSGGRPTEQVPCFAVGQPAAVRRRPDRQRLEPARRHRGLRNAPRITGETLAAAAAAASEGGGDARRGGRASPRSGGAVPRALALAWMVGQSVPASPAQSALTAPTQPATVAGSAAAAGQQQPASRPGSSWRTDGESVGGPSRADGGMKMPSCASDRLVPQWPFHSGRSAVAVPQWPGLAWRS